MVHTCQMEGECGLVTWDPGEDPGGKMTISFDLTGGSVLGWREGEIRYGKIADLGSEHQNSLCRNDIAVFPFILCIQLISQSNKYIAILR